VLHPDPFRDIDRLTAQLLGTSPGCGQLRSVGAEPRVDSFGNGRPTRSSIMLRPHHRR
jgi:hypothetical protein